MKVGGGVKAARIADLLEKFGVNTFSSTSAVSNMWGSWPADYSTASVIAALKWLTGSSGLTIRVREYHYAARRVWQEPWCETVRAATGSRFSVAIGAGGGTNDATSIAAMAATSLAGSQWMEQAEGVNEPNNDFGSGSIPTDSVVAAQAVLGPINLKVGGPSVVFGLPNPAGYIMPGYMTTAQVGSIKGTSTFANAHLYPPDQVDLDDGSGMSAMVDTVTGVGGVYGHPVTITEWHPTLYNQRGKKLDPVYDAYYAACFFLSAERAGVDAHYWFALLDYGTVYLSGLFPQTGGVSPRPAANTIRAMFTLTGDAGATKRTFETGSMDYTVTGLPKGGQHSLFQNSDGVFFLFVWAAQSLPDGPTTPVTVTFGQPHRVRVYKVSAATAPTTVRQDLSNVSLVSLALGGAVYLLAIT